VGPVEVLVDAEGYESARELLLTDDVESSFVGSAWSPAERRTGREVLWLALVVVLVILFAFARMAARV
jgi:hypothetical protein